MLDCKLGSPHEMRLESLLLARIMTHAASDPQNARAVARTEARRLYCLALLVIYQLRDTRELFGGPLMGGIDADLRDHVLGIADPFDTTIARELLSWRDAARNLSVARPR